MKETYSLLAIIMPQLYLDFSSSCSVHWCRPTRGSVEKSKEINLESLTNKGLDMKERKHLITIFEYIKFEKEK